MWNKILRSLFGKKRYKIRSSPNLKSNLKMHIKIIAERWRAPPPRTLCLRKLGALPQTPASDGRGLRPQAPIGHRRLGAPPLDPATVLPPWQISGYAPGQSMFKSRNLSLNKPKTALVMLKKIVLWLTHNHAIVAMYNHDYIRTIKASVTNC